MVTPEEAEDLETREINLKNLEEKSRDSKRPKLASLDKEEEEFLTNKR